MGKFQREACIREKKIWFQTYQMKIYQQVMINKAYYIGCGSGQECDLGNSSSGKARVMRVES